MQAYFILIFSFCSWIPIFAQDQKNVILLDHWTDTTISIAVEGARFSDLWGFTQNGEDYCAIGSSEGVEILHVAEDGLSFIDRAPGAFQGFTVVHRDMKTYNNYLYMVGDEGTATLQIFDLKTLPDSIHKVYDSNALFGICHNIFIDTTNAKLYACGANNSGMKVLDLADPIAPVLLNDFTNVSYVHDCFVANDTAFLNCGFDGLQIYDFSESIPIQLGVLDFYVDQGYNHSGWMSPNGKQYAFIDETQGTKIKLCNLLDLALIQVDETFATPNFQDFVPHNIILGNRLAFVSYYNAGLRIFNVSNSPIREIGHYDTFTDETAYKLNGAWGVFVFEGTNRILICDRQNGVFLFSFPIGILESGNGQTLVSNSPFIDENSILISPRKMDLDGLKFSIADLKGALVYSQENYLNWVNVPINLSPGVYYFTIYDKEGKRIETGKFAKAN